MGPFWASGWQTGVCVIFYWSGLLISDAEVIFGRPLTFIFLISRLWNFSCFLCQLLFSPRFQHDTTVAGLLSTLELYNSYNTSLPFLGIPKYTVCKIQMLFLNSFSAVFRSHQQIPMISLGCRFNRALPQRHCPDIVEKWVSKSIFEMLSFRSFNQAIDWSNVNYPTVRWFCFCICSPLAILSSEPQVLHHPRCDVLCPFDKLVKETQDYVVDDWDKECRSGEFGDAIDGIFSPPIISTLPTCVFLHMLLHWFTNRSVRNLIFFEHLSNNPNTYARFF